MSSTKSTTLNFRCKKTSVVKNILLETCVKRLNSIAVFPVFTYHQPIKPFGPRRGISVNGVVRSHPYDDFAGCVGDSPEAEVQRPKNLLELDKTA